MSHRLHAVHIHKQEADHRSGQHTGHQHFYPIGYDLLIADENPDDRFPEQKIKYRGSNSRYKAALLGIPFHTPEPLHISHSIAVSQKRLHAVCQSHLQEGDKHVGFKYDSDGRHRGISISYQKLVQNDGGHAHQGGKYRRRKPGRTGLGQYAGPGFEIFPMDGKDMAFLQEIPQIISARHHIPDGSGDGGSRSALSQDRYKDRIQHDIGDGTDHASNHRLFAGAFRPDNKTGRRRPDNERRAVRDMEGIASGKFISLFVCSEKSQDRIHENDQDRREQNTDDQGSVSHKRRGIFRPLLLLLSQRPGQHGAASHAQHIGKSHHQDKYRIRQADRRHLQRISGLPHEKSICHIIEHSHQTADHAGHRHLHHSLRNRRLSHQFMFVHMFIPPVPDFPAS